MNNINTKFAPKHANDIAIDKVIQQSLMKSKRDKRRINAAKSIDSFGGKRFLGLTPKGNRVFASYLISNDGTLTMSFTHKLDVLLKKGAKLAGNRFDYKLNAKVTQNNAEIVRETKTKTGEVTLKTLQWLQRLKNLVDGHYPLGFYKGKVTKSMFTKVANAIYVGTNQEDDISIWDIRKAWKFPEHNPYFNPEQAWSYPDEL